MRDVRVLDTASEYNAEGSGAFLIVCDHATNHIPVDFNELGVSIEDRQKHIAWDPGTAYIGKLLADRFDAPAIMCGTSRLVIDCNRRIGHPTLVPSVSDGIPIPGNQNLANDQIGLRIERYYLAYHYRIVAALERFRSAGVDPIFLSIHSFTPHMNDFDRPWSIGISHTPDRRLTAPLIDVLRRSGKFLVGDDEPYGSDADVDYTTFAHAFGRGLKHIQVEFRQDLVGSDEGAHEWGSLFAEAVEQVLDLESKPQELA